MIILIDIPDTDIPKRQDILSIDLCFIDGQVGQCTYPFEVLQENCKDCKWRKDSDEVFRRGVSMEDLCAACHIRSNRKRG